MKKRFAALVLALAMAIFGFTQHAAAQTVVTAVTYSVGWNMVGGATGTDFSNASGLFAYGPSGYYTPAAPRTITCQGYWAYFTSMHTINLAPPPSGPGVNCALQPGWNLIGNPYPADTSLPSGLSGYYWNPAAQSYSVVTAIPPGASIWFYASSAGTLTLQNPLASPSPPPPTIEIDNLPAPGPYTLHVGNTIRLLLPAALEHVAQADPTYLKLQGAGLTGPLTCIAGPACSLSLVNEFWTWQAVTPGNTSITVGLLCSVERPPCLAPSALIQVRIIP
ncbi:MAG: hypothetical protein ACRDFX_01850 [Chloroflexota bacterium]